MTVTKKITALLLAAAVSIGSAVSAYAEEGGETSILDPSLTTGGQNSETSLLDPNDNTGGQDPETSVIGTDTEADGQKPPETEVIIPDEETEEQKPESGVDLSDIDYTPIDLAGYEQWDGKAKMVEGTDYYISGTVKISKNFSLPKGSRLVITPGSNVTIYKDRNVILRGNVVIEPKATLALSGTLTLSSGASLENYGTIQTTVSSVVKIYGEYILRKDSAAVYSGRVNIYKDGIYLNYGGTTLTKSAKLYVTGDFQTPEGGKLINKGYFAVTINGRATFTGALYLYGELINSGVFVFEKNVRYFKSKGSRFAVSKSSRLIDYRYKDPEDIREPEDESDESTATDTGIKGIDVSYAQGAIDWAKVKKAGVEFAILRASRGYISDAKPMMEDVTFQYNVTQATEHGIEVGVYHYLYAYTVEEAREEARFFIETIKPYNITYPVVLDVEEQYQADLGKKQITAMCKAFLEEIEAAGYYPMLYSNKAWLTNFLDMEQLKDYDVWLAQWNTVPTYDGPFGIWQYSSKGIVSGIDGYVDLNLAYKDYAKIIRQGGYNNLKKSADAA